MKGGYSFARPPAEITVLEVVELLEGELGADAGPSRPGLDRGGGSGPGVLAGTTIAELAEREAQAAGAQMYYLARQVGGEAERTTAHAPQSQAQSGTRCTTSDAGAGAGGLWFRRPWR